MNYSYAYVLEKSFPTRQTSVVGNTYSGITWHDGLPPISDADIQAADEQLFKTSDYLIQRANEYNNQGIDVNAKILALWDRIMENNTTSSDALQAKINSIKVKYPPPS